MKKVKLNGVEPIEHSNGLTVTDFWSWAYSDLLSNTNRSVFAEFLVAAALDITASPRIEWDAVDLRYNGKKIEVKASSHLQSWQQNKPYSMKFDIEKKRGWDAQTNTYAEEKCRSADCYVFCVYPELDPEKVNVLDTSKWLFYVVETSNINEVCSDQKSISYSRIRKLYEPVRYGMLKQGIESVLRFHDGV